MAYNDEINLARLKEDRRHNLEQEKADMAKARAALSTARSKRVETAVKAGSGILGTIKGLNELEWGITGDPSLDEAGKTSFLTYDTGEVIMAHGIKQQRVSLFVVDLRQLIGGVYEDVVSPWYMEIVNLYNFIRGKNKGATNYNQNDLLVYCFIPLTVSIALNQFDRILKLAYNPDLKTPITARQALAALGLNAQSIISNRENIKAAIAHVKYLLAQLPVPATLKVYQRWLWLTNWIFLDENSGDRMQMYIPRFGYVHNPQTSDIHYKTLEVELRCLNAELGDEYTSEDVIEDLKTLELIILYAITRDGLKAIAGDIENAFGESVEGVYDVKQAPDYEASPYLLDEEFLLQLRNAILTVGPVSSNITQLGLKIDDKGRLGQGSWDSRGYLIPPLFLMRDTSPYFQGNDTNIIPEFKQSLEPAEVRMAMSFHPRFSVGMESIVIHYYDDKGELASQTLTANPQAKIAFVQSSGTEIITGIHGFQFDRDAYDLPNSSVYWNSNEIISLGELAYVVSFSHLPLMYARLNGQYIYVSPIENYASITRAAWDNIFRTKAIAIWHASGTKRPKQGSPAGKSDKKPFFNKGKPKDKKPDGEAKKGNDQSSDDKAK